MGFNTNTTNRLPAITPIGTKFVFDISVLPAPSGNVIDLEPGNYIIANGKNGVDFGVNSLRFDHVGEDLSIRTIDKGISKITSATTGIFLDVVNANNVDLSDLDITLSGAGATFLNIFGLTNTITSSAVSVLYSGSGTKTIGIVDIGNFNATGLVNINWTNGLTFQNMSSINNVNSFNVSDFTGSGALFDIKALGLAANFNNSAMVASSSQSIFDISPTISALSEVLISRVLNRGAGTFFKSGTTGDITLFADASITATAIATVSSGTAIPAGGNYARFNHSGTDVFVGQRVVNSTFTPEVTYNQTLIVTVTGAGFFEGNIESTGASIAFTNDDAGSYLSDSVTVTSTAHGQSNLQALLIRDTIDYNAGYTIYNSLTNTFQINADFDTAETVGEWDTGSLIQKDKRLDVSSAGKQANSMNLAFGEMNGNSVATVIAASDTYQAIDVTGMAQNPATERWTLIDPVAGIFRYDGLNPLTGAIFTIPNSTKSGATQNYRFTESIDGAIPVFATASYAPMEVKTTKVSAPFTRPATVNPGQTVQIMVAGDGHSDNLTITDFTFSIRG